MIKIEISSNAGAFKINGVPYQKGAYEIIKMQNLVGFKCIHDRNYNVAPVNYDQWVNAANVPFATVNDLISELETLFFLVNNSGGSGLNYTYVASNFTDLITNVAPAPTEPFGTLAYVYNSQGTAWLPGSMGGTYYANGAYVWTATGWVSDRNNLAAAFQTLNDDVAALELSQTAQDGVISSKIPLAQKGAASGVATLDVNTKIPIGQLPNISTDVVTEASSLYFTTARVLATALSGLSIVGGSVIGTDTILVAFGKIQNQINTVVNSILTGFVVGGNVAIIASDNILQAFGKSQGQINTINNNKAATFATINDTLYPTVKAVEERSIEGRFQNDYNLFTDFVNSVNGGDELTFTQSILGVGSILATSVYEEIADQTGAVKPRIGVAQLRSGNGALRYAALIYGNINIFRFSTFVKEVSLKFSFRLEAVTTAVVTYNFYMGFSNEFLIATLLVNTNRFAVIRTPNVGELPFTYKLALSRGNAAISTFDTGITCVPNVYHDFEISYIYDGVNRQIVVKHFGIITNTVLDTDLNFILNNSASLVGLGVRNFNNGGSTPAIRNVFYDSAQIRIRRV